MLCVYSKINLFIAPAFVSNVLFKKNPQTPIRILTVLPPLRSTLHVCLFVIRLILDGGSKQSECIEGQYDTRECNTVACPTCRLGDTVYDVGETIHSPEDGSTWCVGVCV